VSGGGSGGYSTSYLTVTQGQTYSLTVGSGGKTAVYFTEDEHGKYSWTDGNSGFVLIAYGGDI